MSFIFKKCYLTLSGFDLAYIHIFQIKGKQEI
jgi:hypothetical protein